MKNTPIPAAIRTEDTGIGMKLSYIESSTVGEVVGKFSKASTVAKDDAYQLAKGTGNGKHIKGVILLLQNLQIYAILKNELKALDSLLEATSAFLRRNLTDHYNFIM